MSSLSNLSILIIVVEAENVTAEHFVDKKKDTEDDQIRGQEVSDKTAQRRQEVSGSTTVSTGDLSSERPLKPVRLTQRKPRSRLARIV